MLAWPSCFEMMPTRLGQCRVPPNHIHCPILPEGGVGLNRPFKAITEVLDVAPSRISINVFIQFACGAYSICKIEEVVLDRKTAGASWQCACSPGNLQHLFEVSKESVSMLGLANGRVHVSHRSQHLDNDLSLSVIL